MVIYCAGVQPQSASRVKLSGVRLITGYYICLSSIGYGQMLYILIPGVRETAMAGLLQSYLQYLKINAEATWLYLRRLIGCRQKINETRLAKKKTRQCGLAENYYLYQLNIIG